MQSCDPSRGVGDRHSLLRSLWVCVGFRGFPGVSGRVGRRGGEAAERRQQRGDTAVIPLARRAECGGVWRQGVETGEWRQGKGGRGSGLRVEGYRGGVKGLGFRV